MLIPGDFSLGTSIDRQKDLDDREVRNLNGTNTNEVMKNMGIFLDMVVANKISPETEESIRVKLKIDGINSFSPESVAKQVPQIRSLLLLKKLLLEIQSNIANKKEFAQLLNKLYANQTALEKLKGELKEYSPTLPKKSMELIESKEESNE
jgi:type VI secretion system protein ImpB